LFWLQVSGLPRAVLPPGRILVHATDPLLLDLSGLELGTTTSAAEQIASWQPGARVVKRSIPLPPTSLKSGVRGRQVFCGTAGMAAPKPK
jgi:predicted dinucleotide-binding enzyme